MERKFQYTLKQGLSLLFQLFGLIGGKETLALMVTKLRKSVNKEIMMKASAISRTFIVFFCVVCVVVYGV